MHSGLRESQEEPQGSVEEDSQRWNSSALLLTPTGLFLIAQFRCKWKLELTLRYKVCVKYGEGSHVDLVNTLRKCQMPYLV